MQIMQRMNKMKPFQLFLLHHFALIFHFGVIELLKEILQRIIPILMPLDLKTKTWVCVLGLL